MTNLYSVEGDSFSIGRNGFNDISLPENDFISSVHITITKKDRSDLLIMCGQNGGYLSGRFVWKNESRIIEYGEEICISDFRLVWLHDFILVKSESKYNSRLMTPSLRQCEHTSEKVFFQHFCPSPRSVYGIDNTPVELEAPPEKQNEEVQGKLMAIGPAFTMAIPMILGMVISMTIGKSDSSGSSSFMVAGIITAVSSAMFGVIWGGINLNARTRRVIENEKKRRNMYENYVNQCESIIRDKYFRNRNTLRLMNPCIKERFNYTNEKIYIFNKEAINNNILNIRLGTGKDKFNVNITVPKGRMSVISDDLKDVPEKLKKKYEFQNEVPICIDLIKYNTVGFICNDSNKRNEILRGMLLSVASMIEPGKIKVAALFSNDTINPFKLICYRLLPHIWDEKVCLISESIDEAIKHAEKLRTFSGYKFIITDCYKNIRELTDSENTIYVVIAESFINLPDMCKAVIQSDQRFNGVIFLSGDITNRKDIYFDTITESECIKYIRRLSRLSTGMENCENDIPEKISYLEMIKKDPIMPEEIINQWNESSTIDDISIPIGIKDSHDILYFDFHEKKYGPHGLVAGMTGSGKSEILQTFILSLSLKYHPYEVGFFLIDYKGGGMASLFDGLPHIVGCISNLSGEIIQRAMVSVRGENERRQILFNKAKVNSIYEYTSLYKDGKVEAAIPHIFIIVDEFAELKSNEPEFMKELISVARVGRSLGIHLILATQKPAGTVDENIWSNSKFKICLRVQSKQDSNEMLHRPDAADILNPGRAYLQVGNDEVYLQFQSAYTRALLKKDGYRKKTVIYTENDNDERSEEKCERSITELQILTENIKEAGRREGLNKIRKLWLPPLEDKIVYPMDNHNNAINIGIYDNPRRQQKSPYSISISESGHIFINGSTTSGKSTLLMTISYVLVKNYSPKEINYYIVDFSSCKLIPFSKSNMCGGFYCEENESEIEKLIYFLKDELNKRKKLFKGINFTQYKKHNNSVNQIVLIIDGFGLFREKTAGDFDDVILDILKNGERLGITMICTAGGIGTGEMPTRMFDHFKTTIGLCLTDKYKYSETLRIPADKVISHACIPGRGEILHQGEALLFQAYLPINAEDDYELIKKLEDIVENENAGYGDGNVATLVPQIPSDLSVEKLMEVWDKQENIIPVGYEVKTGKVFGIQINERRNIIVSGDRGSGKTGFCIALKKITEMLGITILCDSAGEGERLCICSKNTEINILVCPDSASLTGRQEIKRMAGENPLVLHFGGNFDGQDFADFSFIPYLSRSKPKPTGTATVCGSGYYNGDVIVVKD